MYRQISLRKGKKKYIKNLICFLFLVKKNDQTYNIPDFYIGFKRFCI